MTKLEFLVDQSCDRIVVGKKEFPLNKPYGVHTTTGEKSASVWLELLPKNGNRYDDKKIERLREERQPFRREWKKTFPINETGIGIMSGSLPPIFGGNAGEPNPYIMITIPATTYAVHIITH